MTDDLTQIGLSIKAHERLSGFEALGLFGELREGYQFAIGLALSRGIVPDEVAPPKKTMFSLGTIDPDGSIEVAIRSLMPCGDVGPYRWAERLAEAGIAIMAKAEDEHNLDLLHLLDEASAVSETHLSS